MTFNASAHNVHFTKPCLFYANHPKLDRLCYAKSEPPHWKSLPRRWSCSDQFVGRIERPTCTCHVIEVVLADTVADQFGKRHQFIESHSHIFSEFGSDKLIEFTSLGLMGHSLAPSRFPRNSLLTMAPHYTDEIGVHIDAHLAQPSNNLRNR